MLNHQGPEASPWTRRLALCALLLTACGGSNSASDAGPDAADPTDVCVLDSECDNGLFCDGMERCAPTDPLSRVNGCVSGTACGSARLCDEDADTCVTECAISGDADGDGHAALECGGDDCDDSDADRYPGNVELCDSRHDEDCDPTTFGTTDADGDGAIADSCCNVDGSALRCGTDCDDTTLARRPRQLEICDMIDNDCDGIVDEDTSAVDWFTDDDGDGFGAPGSAISSCSPLAGRSLLDTDCDDARRDVSPVGVERCNGRDDDCDGQVDEGCADSGTMDSGVDSGVDSGTMDSGTMDSGADGGVDSGVDGGVDGGSSAFAIAEFCSVDGDCGGSRVCRSNVSSRMSCHDVCTSDVDCGRSASGRACVWDGSDRYCSHPCDPLADTGCLGTDTCDVSTFIFTETLDASVPVRDAYIECRAVGGGAVDATCSLPQDCAAGLTCSFVSGGGQQCRTRCRVGFGTECAAGDFCCPWTDRPIDAAGREIGRCRHSMCS